MTRATHLELSENTFTQNTDVNIATKRGTITDSYSNYLQNYSSDSGAALNILKEGTYTGKSVIFDFNVVDKYGGAVYATG